MIIHLKNNKEPTKQSFEVWNVKKFVKMGPSWTKTCILTYLYIRMKQRIKTVRNTICPKLRIENHGGQSRKYIDSRGSQIHDG